MSQSDEVILSCYATAPYACSYLEGQEARSQVVVPAENISTAVYSRLLRLGFRRSGGLVYRPYCDACRQCVSVRVVVADFVRSRNDRRCWKQHADLTVQRVPLRFSAEHYRLYHRYQCARHEGGEMAIDNTHQYIDFILKSYIDSQLFEFRDAQGILRMVSLVDQVEDGLSAVYTFFDADQDARSFGTFNILWQIERTRQLGLPYLYLGYWLSQCRKMRYKDRFQPLQYLMGSSWETQPSHESVHSI